MAKIAESMRTSGLWKEVFMEVKDFCRDAEVELHGWKTKMYDMVRKVDKLRGTDKGNMASQVEELHKHVSEMERILDQLRTECPIEFGTQRKQIEETTEGLKKKYDDAMSAVLQF